MVSCRTLPLFHQVVEGVWPTLLLQCCFSLFRFLHSSLKAVFFTSTIKTAVQWLLHIRCVCLTVFIVRRKARGINHLNFSLCPPTAHATSIAKVINNDSRINKGCSFHSFVNWGQDQTWARRVQSVGQIDARNIYSCTLQRVQQAWGCNIN